MVAAGLATVELELDTGLETAAGDVVRLAAEVVDGNVVVDWE